MHKCISFYAFINTIRYDIHVIQMDISIDTLLIGIYHIHPHIHTDKSVHTCAKTYIKTLMYK